MLVKNKEAVDSSKTESNNKVSGPKKELAGNKLNLKKEMRRLDTAEMKKEFQEKMMKQQARNKKDIKPESSKLDVKL